MLSGKKILAIDDARSIRTFLRISLESQGAAFYEADTAHTGLKMCEEVRPDLVVLDLGLPDEDGLTILPDIKRAGSAPQVIVLTVRKEHEMKEKARQLGADAYITKPFMVDELMDAIELHVLKNQ
jgi:DNA-binding response OmpR family regulator